MKIGFIGAGKVGCSLGRYFAQKHQIVGYASRTMQSAKEAARLTTSNAFEDALALCQNSEIVFITTPDGEIEPTWRALTKLPQAKSALVDTFVCHCSGALTSEVLTQAASFGAYAYSLHPLFAIPSKTTSLEELGQAFFTIEGNQNKIDTMRGLIEGMGNRCQVLEASAKTRYHAAAALASNQVVALYRLACDELARCGFSARDAEAALAPLFLGNATHIARDGVVASLSGPAERGDLATIEKHLNCLQGDTREVYRLLNEVLLRIAHEKHAAQESSRLYTATTC